MLLGTQPGLDVVGEAENGREALLAVDKLSPDVVLMDVVMPGLNGVEAARQVKKYASKTKVVMLSGFADEEQIVSALRAGASGYLVKNSDISELVLAIQTVHRGNKYFSSSLAEGMDLWEITNKAANPSSKSGLDNLTSREREVLQLIAEGHSNQAVADLLFVSVKTVEAHKAHLTQKLNAKNKSDLIRYALRKGIIREETSESTKALSETSS